MSSFSISQKQVSQEIGPQLEPPENGRCSCFGRKFGGESPSTTHLIEILVHID